MHPVENNQKALKTFNLFNHLKQQKANTSSSPYFLATQHTYQKATVRFPFRTFTFGIGITYSGQPNVFKIGSADFIVEQGCLATVDPGIVSQWMGNYNGEHDTIYFTENLFDDLLNVNSLRSLAYFQPGATHVIQLQPSEIEKIRLLFTVLKAFQEQEKLVPGLVHSLLMLVSSIHTSSQEQTQPSLSHKQMMASKFRGLVATHFPEHKDVCFYASALHITPKYLSELLVETMGKPAKTLIDEHIFMEAKSLIRQTTMTVEEICYWLGYDDTSYFTKVFRKWEGMTPVAYRKLSGMFM